MFAWWGGAVVRFRWLVLAGTLAVVVAGAVWGTGVFTRLASGGFDDPRSQSSQADARIQATFGRYGTDVVVLYSSPLDTVDTPAMRTAITSALGRLTGRPEVASLSSYYSTPTPDSTPTPALVATDRHATFAVIQLRDGDLAGKKADLAAITPLVQAGPAVQTEIGGDIALQDDATAQVRKDIVRAAAFSLPVLLVLLVLIFGGVLPALMPLLVAAVAALGSLMVIRALTRVTEVSVSAVIMIALLGLAMTVDFTLFVVSRFREELVDDRPVKQAMRATVATAGRTVVVGGLAAALALSSLLLFPVGVLRSMAYGGIAAVLVAMVAAVTTLPAALSLLGRRARRRERPARHRRASAQTWARLPRRVLAHPLFYVVVVGVVLLGLAIPFPRVRFGGVDERVLPAGTPSRAVAEAVAADFPGGNLAPIVAYVTGMDGSAFAQRASTVDGVAAASVTAERSGAALVTIAYRGVSGSAKARAIVARIRALPIPRGAQVLVTGRPAVEADQLHTLAVRLPFMVVSVWLVMFVLLLLAFGSVAVPLAAIVTNVISVGASLGVVVWVLQDGHLSNLLGFTATGMLEPTTLIAMLAVLWGLCTVFQVLLLSRIREEWNRTGKNPAAVAIGLQRTGGIITAAALLLIIVFGGLAAAGTGVIQMFGVGLVVAVAVDAALVRALLVPAMTLLLGRWNWWAPGPLARNYRPDGPGVGPVGSARATDHTSSVPVRADT
jgi:RND superfamily putative drug exporter